MGTLEDGSVFDDTRARHEPYTFRVGLGFVIGGWDKGIPTMMKGADRPKNGRHISFHVSIALGTGFRRNAELI